MGKVIPAGRHEKKRGAARMAEFGYKQVQLWLDHGEASKVISAAKREGVKLATWCRLACVKAAQES